MYGTMVLKETNSWIESLKPGRFGQRPAAQNQKVGNNKLQDSLQSREVKIFQQGFGNLIESVLGSKS